jgi:hypothetical protein
VDVPAFIAAQLLGVVLALPLVAVLTGEIRRD